MGQAVQLVYTLTNRGAGTAFGMGNDGSEAAGLVFGLASGVLIGLGRLLEVHQRLVGDAALLAAVDEVVRAIDRHAGADHAAGDLGVEGVGGQAQALGNLKTTPQQVVVVTNVIVEKTIEQQVVVVTNTIVQIQPANPQRRTMKRSKNRKASLHPLPQ